MRNGEGDNPSSETELRAAYAQFYAEIQRLRSSMRLLENRRSVLWRQHIQPIDSQINSISESILNLSRNREQIGLQLQALDQARSARDKELVRTKTIRGITGRLLGDSLLLVMLHGSETPSIYRSLAVTLRTLTQTPQLIEIRGDRIRARVPNADSLKVRIDPGSSYSFLHHGIDQETQTVLARAYEDQGAQHDEKLIRDFLGIRIGVGHETTTFQPFGLVKKGENIREVDLNIDLLKLAPAIDSISRCVNTSFGNPL